MKRLILLLLVCAFALSVSACAGTQGLQRQTISETFPSPNMEPIEKTQ